MGALAPLLLAFPAIGEVQDGTYALLNTVEETINIDYNPRKCDLRPIDGSYNLQTRTITLCTGPEVDANDHDTVRHEVWHAIQHCTTPPNYEGLRPVISVNDPAWINTIGQFLSVAQVASIRENYPKYAWDVEMEAHAIANSLSAEEIEEIFLLTCAG